MQTLLWVILLPAILYVGAWVIVACIIVAVWINKLCIKG